MVTVKIHGGLGNQMFQYAAARALSLRNRDALRIDPSPLFDRTPWKHYTFRDYALGTVFAINPEFNLPAKIAAQVRIPYVAKVVNKYYPRLLGAMGYWTYAKEKRDYVFDPEVFSLQGNVYLDGHWQTERYFKDFAREIREDFTFRHALEGRTAELADEIRRTNAVCVNVRRREIVSDPVLSAIFNVVTPEYYRDAVALVKKRAGGDITCFVVSDEIEWCRRNLNIDAPHRFVGEEHYGVEFRDALRLMTLCKHFIIPNSSFAWWAAWLGQYEKKVVVAPKKWVNNPAVEARDLLPESWVQL